MKTLELDFLFYVKESQIVKITICDSSSFSLKVIGDKNLNQPIEEFFDAYHKGLTCSLPLKEEYSSFKSKVLNTLKTIPFGKTTTYKDLAILSECPKGYRAVGNCLNKNPFPLAIPCHRVLSSSGDIGGFAYGKRVKEKLLLFEAYI